MSTDKNALRKKVRECGTDLAARFTLMREARDAGALEIVPESWRAQALETFLDLPDHPLVAGFSSEFANYSTEQRKEMAKDGRALPDGSYPIDNATDLHNAILSYGRANSGDRTKVKRHIIKRARSLGKTDMIPDSWQHKSASNLEETLNERARMFNARHPDQPLTTSKLRTVYLRGVSSYNAARDCTTMTAAQHGMTRVNSFLRLCSGDPSARRTDADLLPDQTFTELPETVSETVVSAAQAPESDIGAENFYRQMLDAMTRKITDE